MISLNRVKLWHNEDDQKLLDLIQKHGHKKWKEISTEFENTHAITRTPKQCRDRWCNVLKIGNKNDFSAEEASQIFSLINIHGSKWSLLSKIIETKTENQIKNFVNATIRRNIRRFNKSKSTQHQIPLTNLKLLEIPDLQEIITAPKTTSQSFFQNKVLSRETIEEIKRISLEYRKLNLDSDETSDAKVVALEIFNMTDDYVPWSSNFLRKDSFPDIELYLDSI